MNDTALSSCKIRIYTIKYLEQAEPECSECRCERAKKEKKKKKT